MSITLTVIWNGTFFIVNFHIQQSYFVDKYTVKLELEFHVVCEQIVMHSKYLREKKHNKNEYLSLIKWRKYSRFDFSHENTAFFWCYPVECCRLTDIRTVFPHRTDYFILLYSVFTEYNIRQLYLKKKWNRFRH